MEEILDIAIEETITFFNRKEYIKKYEKIADESLRLTMLSSDELRKMIYIPLDSYESHKKDHDEIFYIDSVDLNKTIKEKLHEFRKHKNTFTNQLIINSVHSNGQISLKGLMHDYCLLRYGYQFYLHEYERLYPLSQNVKDNQLVETPQPNKNQKPEQETPKYFEELFYNSDLVTPCIDILKYLDPPLIDTDYNYIGKSKGTFCVWIDEMKRQGIVKYNSDRKIYASLIQQKIKRFSIDESMFGKPQITAEKKYRIEIKTKISKIKVSQNSQKGK